MAQVEEVDDPNASGSQRRADKSDRASPARGREAVEDEGVRAGRLQVRLVGGGAGEAHKEARHTLREEGVGQEPGVSAPETQCCALDLEAKEEVEPSTGREHPAHVDCEQNRVVDDWGVRDLHREVVWIGEHSKCYNGPREREGRDVSERWNETPRTTCRGEHEEREERM